VEKSLADYDEGMQALLKKPRMTIKPIIFFFLRMNFSSHNPTFGMRITGQLITLDKVIIVRSIADNVEA